MGEKNSSNKYLLVIGIMAIIIAVLSGFILVFKFPIQYLFPEPIVSTPAPTQPPIANLVLSSDKAYAVLSLGQTPHLSLTITNNGYGTVAFPCSAKIIETVQVQHQGGFSITMNPTLGGYGTVSDNYGGWIASPDHPMTVGYYATIQDSTGAKLTSNTISIEYR